MGRPAARHPKAGIAPIIHRLRVEKGWTREALAYHSGLSYAAVEQLESGRRQDPRMSTLMALARALEIPVDKLVPTELLP